jgi:hypothetical protein
MQGEKRMSGRSQAPEGNEAMAGCNGNPVKQWHEDKHSQSLIACVHTEEDSESGTARNGSTGAELSIAPCWKSSGRGLEAEKRAFALTDKARRTMRLQIIVTDKRKQKDYFAMGILARSQARMPPSRLMTS